MKIKCINRKKQLFIMDALFLVSKKYEKSVCEFNLDHICKIIQPLEY